MEINFSHLPTKWVRSTLVLALAFLAAAIVARLVVMRRSTIEGSRQSLSPLKRPSAIPHEGEPAISEIRRVFPELSAKVDDWSSFKPEMLVVAPYAGLALPFQAVRVTTENGVATWVGRNGLRGASLVGIGKRDHWYGVLTMIGGTFDIRVQSGAVTVVEKSGALNCPTTARPLPSAPPNHEASLGTARVRTADATPITGDPSIHTSGSTIYTVDVVFFYSQDAEQAAISPAGSLAAVPSYLDSVYRAYIETENLILEQSKVDNLRWHFLGILRVPDYAPTYKGTFDNGKVYYDMVYDLQIMADPTSAVGQFVASKELALSADQSVLVVSDSRQFGGLGDQPGHHSVVVLTDDVLSVAHEMGHNFGLTHDRLTEGLPDNDGTYAHGYLFKYLPSWFGGVDAPDIPGAVNPNTFGDIMSYSGRLPFYSNPDVSVIGNDFASSYITRPDNNSYALGVPADQPKAANCARALREAAAAMSGYRTPAGFTFPALAVQPIAAATVGLGGSLHLAVIATGTSLSYQWRKNGTNIPGATNAAYDLTNATMAVNGSYDVVVTNALGSAISRGTAVDVSDQPLSARLVNISTRSGVSSGDGVQIAGFVITGNVPKTVLIRAAGPALASAGVQSFLADPTLELHDTHGVIGTNDDWSADAIQADAIRSAAAQVGAGAWTTGSKDAAILTTLNPGVYTAIVAGKTSGSGVALVEVYEVSQGASAVVNISTRSGVSSGDGVQIAGFVITGTGPKTVLIRAAGPALVAAGINGFLADPTLELHDSVGVIGSNDDWSADAVQADAIRSAALQVGAGAWTTGSKDAAVLVTLNPGVYTAIVAGKAGSTGVALVEVYQVSP